ncbi:MULTISPECIES: hypothetical protein [unclassified Xanthobacter]|uniref:hypothetical protein n=1 Tax=unclassified Xanthobacter TaxID=2623496 RepID=UPI001F4091E5|nr:MULTISPECIES: hypothetical protein [unclassified Xanthobacter]
MADLEKIEAAVAALMRPIEELGMHAAEQFAARVAEGWRADSFERGHDPYARAVEELRRIVRELLSAHPGVPPDIIKHAEDIIEDAFVARSVELMYLAAAAPQGSG